MNQPGSNDIQSHAKGTHNHEVHDMSKNWPNGERTMTNSNKSKQAEEENHDIQDRSKNELGDERGGHGHSDHSGNRNGSRKRQ